MILLVCCYHGIDAVDVVAEDIEGGIRNAAGELDYEIVVVAALPEEDMGMEVVVHSRDSPAEASVEAYDIPFVMVDTVVASFEATFVVVLLAVVAYIHIHTFVVDYNTVMPLDMEVDQPLAMEASFPASAAA